MIYKSGEHKSYWPLYCLGFCTCLIPIFGSGLLLLIGLLLLTVSSWLKIIRNLELSWAGPFLVLLLVWLTAELLGGVSLSEFQQLSTNITVRALRSSIFLVPNEVMTSAAQFCRYLLCFALISAFSRESAGSKAFVSGLLLSLPLVALVAILEYSGAILKNQIPNMNEFWSGLGRWPISFSDPNAAGVALFLVVVLVWVIDGSSRTRSLVLALSALLALLAGSRSFFLGIGLFFIFGCGRTKLRRWLWLGLSLVAILMGHTLLFDYVPAYSAAFSGTLAQNVPGFARVSDSLRLDNLSQSFSSRIIFWRIAALVFLEHPWFGVGPSQFAQYVPEAALKLGVPLGTWTDNTNNFYLGLGAEMGVVGIGAFLLVLLNRKLKIESQAVPGMLAFLVLLLFGPHIVFDEVAVLSGVLIGLATMEQKAYFGGWWARAAAIVCFPALLTIVHSGERGVFAREVDNKGSFQWTRSAARVVLPCMKGAARIALQNPLAARRRQELKVTTSEEELRLNLENDQEYLLTLHCPIEPVADEALPQNLLVNISVSAPIIPETLGYKGDSRPLGVKVRRLP